MNIAVAGMGYVGLAAAVLLSQHHRVTVVDPLEWKVERINRRQSPLADTLIAEHLADPTLSLTAVTDGAEAFRTADYVVLAVPTNYRTESHSFDTSAVERVVGEVLTVNRQAVMVIKSTVPLGYTDALCEAFPGARILFSPEFLREGQALYDNLYPSRIIMGVPENRPELYSTAEEFAGLLHQGARRKDVPVLLMPATEAEAVKLFSNTYLAMRVSFFNELDTYAESRGLDARRIIEDLEGEEGIKYAEEYADGRTERGKKLREIICKEMHFTSLDFQTLDGMVEAIGLPRCQLCTYCWTGEKYEE